MKWDKGMQFLLFPTQFIIYERAQEKAKHWARREGLRWQWQGPKSLDPFCLTASYAAHTTHTHTHLHLAAELLLGADSVIHPSDCLPGHNETPPGWRAAINEHRRGRRAPEITHCVSCPLGKPDVWMYIIGGVFWDIKGRHRRVELAQHSNAALCSWNNWLRAQP